MSALRSVETGLPLVRSANTGISGILYPDHLELVPADQPLMRDFSLPLEPAAPTAATRLARYAAALWLILGAFALISASRRVQTKD